MKATGAAIFTAVLLGFLVVRPSRGCHAPQCDLDGALSTCHDTSAPCSAGHEKLSENTVCDIKGQQCCRMQCAGPGSRCMREDLPCADKLVDAGIKNCYGGLIGYRCCAPLSKVSLSDLVRAFRSQRVR